MRVCRPLNTTIPPRDRGGHSEGRFLHAPVTIGQARGCEVTQPGLIQRQEQSGSAPSPATEDHAREKGRGWGEGMIDRESAAKLLDILTSAKEWPLARERNLLADLYTWAALREANRDFLTPEGWDESKRGAYMVDPLAGRIAEAKADLIFGEAPEFKAGAETDQGNVDGWVEENSLPSELQSAAQVCVSEGEVWWRVLVDKDAADYPILEWHSRTTVFPYYRGRKLLAVAFISIIEEDKRAWRYVELHAEGIVLNRLFEIPNPQVTQRTTANLKLPQATHPGRQFGQPVNLSERAETVDLPEEWPHDTGSLLAGRIINRRGRDPRIGVSDYSRVRDLLFSLNEATIIGHGNLRLTARKRAVVDSSVLTPSVDSAGREIGPPEFDSGEELFIRDQLDQSLDGNRPAPFHVLEYSFDAAALVVWDLHVEDKILIRTRTAPQLVGRHTEGAQTGPALRARLLDSILDANGKARFWDDESPKAAVAIQLVDALPDARGGYGRKYAKPGEPPVIERKSVLPEDEEGQVRRHAQAVGSGLESQFTAIQDLNPEWDEDDVKEELVRIAEEGRVALGAAPPAPGENHF